MALTDYAIGVVKGQNEDLYKNMLSYADKARLILDRLEHEPQFSKYLIDTTSGALLYGKLKALLEQVEQANEAGRRLHEGVADFIKRQEIINSQGR